MLRRLTLDDLPGCLDLSADREWPREEHKWRLLFDVGEVYGVVEDGGRVVGTTVVTRYVDAAAISMVLVAKRRERQGLGRRMMRRALECAGDGPVTLYATEMGRPLYERLGFEVVGAATAHVGRWAGSVDGARSRAARDADWDAIAALDTAVTGVDRGDLIARLPAFAEQVRVVDRDGEVAGYAATWRNVDVVNVGPVIAPDEDTARALIAECAGGEAARVRVDVHHDRPALREWIAERGLAPGFQVSLMAAGGRLPVGDGSRWFAPLMQALG